MGFLEPRDLGAACHALRSILTISSASSTRRWTLSVPALLTSLIESHHSRSAFSACTAPVYLSTFRDRSEYSIQLVSAVAAAVTTTACDAMSYMASAEAAAVSVAAAGGLG